MNKLDQWARRHRILAGIAAFLIIAVCLELAHRIDQENDSRVYWQMTSRGQT
jgi:hypothetical protein